MVTLESESDGKPARLWVQLVVLVLGATALGFVLASIKTLADWVA